MQDNYDKLLSIALGQLAKTWYTVIVVIEHCVS